MAKLKYFIYLFIYLIPPASSNPPPPPEAKKIPEKYYKTLYCSCYKYQPLWFDNHMGIVRIRLPYNIRALVESEQKAYYEQHIEELNHLCQEIGGDYGDLSDCGGPPKPPAPFN